MSNNNSPGQGPNKRHPASHQPSQDLTQAEINARRSKMFLPLMKEREVKLEFSAVSPEGVMIADATKNATDAYKLRGALVSAQLAKDQGQKLLVTASAGNHGAGIACAANLLGLKATVYVPKNAPKAKVEKIERFGAKVEPEGNSFNECLDEALKDVDVRDGKATFVHPFDNEMVVAGQGTIGFELLDKLKDHVRHNKVSKVRVVLPIGGGGLAAGVVSVLKTQWDEKTPLEVIGVVDESSPASLLAMMRGRPVRAAPETLADGAGVAMVGEQFLKVSHLLDGLVLLPHDELIQAMATHQAKTGERLEGAGALALGGEAVLRKLNLLNDPVGTLSVPLITGKNIDKDRFDQEVAAAARMNSKVMKRQGFDVVLEEKPGELLRFLEAVQAYNIASLTYVRKEGSPVAHLRVEFEVARAAEGELAGLLCGDQFPGSTKLREGEQMLYRGGTNRKAPGSESLISLEDKPGSFLRYVRDLSQRKALGAVDFLFYRKPAKPGSAAQVVMGEGEPALATTFFPAGGRDAFPLGVEWMMPPGSGSERIQEASAG